MQTRERSGMVHCRACGLCRGCATPQGRRRARRLAWPPGPCVGSQQPVDVDQRWHPILERAEADQVVSIDGATDLGRRLDLVRRQRDHVRDMVDHHVDGATGNVEDDHHRQVVVARLAPLQHVDTILLQRNLIYHLCVLVVPWRGHPVGLNTDTQPYRLHHAAPYAHIVTTATAAIATAVKSSLIAAGLSFPPNSLVRRKRKSNPPKVPITAPTVPTAAQPIELPLGAPSTAPQKPPLNNLGMNCIGTLRLGVLGN